MLPMQQFLISSTGGMTDTLPYKVAAHLIVSVTTGRLSTHTTKKSLSGEKVVGNPSQDSNTRVAMLPFKRHVIQLMSAKFRPPIAWQGWTLLNWVLNLSLKVQKRKFLRRYFCSQPRHAIS